MDFIWILYDLYDFQMMLYDLYGFWWGLYICDFYDLYGIYMIYIYIYVYTWVYLYLKGMFMCDNFGDAFYPSRKLELFQRQQRSTVKRLFSQFQLRLNQVNPFQLVQGNLLPQRLQLLVAFHMVMFLDVNVLDLNLLCMPYLITTKRRIYIHIYIYTW